MADLAGRDLLESVEMFAGPQIIVGRYHLRDNVERVRMGAGGLAPVVPFGHAPPLGLV